MSEHPPVACPAVCTTRARKFRQISIERKTKASFTINAILYYLGEALPLLVTFNKKREREREQQHNATKAPPRHPCILAQSSRSELVLNETFARIAFRRDT